MPWIPVGRDGAVITLEFEDSSVATIHYITTNHRGLPKEEIEVHVGERSLRMHDYRSLTGRGFDGFEKEQMHPVAFRFRNFLPISAELRLEEPDKGHSAAISAFLKAIEDVAGWFYIHFAGLSLDRKERVLAMLPDEHYPLDTIRASLVRLFPDFGPQRGRPDHRGSLRRRNRR